MPRPTRVFIAADANSQARRLAKVFGESADFVVTGFGATANLTQLAPDKIDLIVAESQNPAAFQALSQAGVPTVWLVPPGSARPLDLGGTNATLPLHASPAQIRAASAAVAAGLHVEPPSRGQSPGREDEVAFQEALTERELQVLNLLADGLSNPVIAKRLGVSRNTVKFHVSSIIG